MFGVTDVQLQRAAELGALPPKGQPYSVPIPGSQAEGRSAVFRHWRFKDRPLLETLDPAITTQHEAFESAATKYPKNKCLGHRPYDPVTKTFGAYEWQDYETVQTRRKNFGAGLVHLHRNAGVQESVYGVGLWCQNRPEWQITGISRGFNVGSRSPY
jgi:long-chain acyl-CoA synthetase